MHTFEDGERRSLKIAVFCAVMDVRRQLMDRRSEVEAGHIDASTLIVRSVECPWISCTLPTLSRKERRDKRVRPPSPARGATVYRTSGALIEAGAFVVRPSGWGAVRFMSDGAVAEQTRGRLPSNTSRNIAGYTGLLAALRRACQRRAVDKEVVFETDNLVIARQMLHFGKGKFACRSPSLQPVFMECAELGRGLNEAGVRWRARHVYSDYNGHANSLARPGALQGDSAWA